MASLMRPTGEEVLEDKIRRTLRENGGLLFAKPALVGRHTYLGRDILAPNSKLEPGFVDDRGYVPVEWWLCSAVMAGNPILKENEGIASFYLNDDTRKEFKSYSAAEKLAVDQRFREETAMMLLTREDSLSEDNLKRIRLYAQKEADRRAIHPPRQSEVPTLFTDILKVCEHDVMGKYLHAWPLIKVLDIGGSVVQPDFGSGDNFVPTEVPPIPCHVHSGYICDGRCCGHGKLEAYFFPPLPAGKEITGAKTRLGIKPGTKKDTLVSCMCQFGVNDSMYKHLNEYEVEPFTGWTIACGCIHAPGPYLTFEVQLPQDDGNLLAWQLGKKIDDKDQRTEEKERSMLRGCADETKLFDEVVNMNLTSASNFKERWFHKSSILEEGPWGRRMQTFFDRFYGEAIEVTPGGSYIVEPSPKPFAMVVWMGAGSVNGLQVSSEDNSHREMLVAPYSTLVIEQNADTDENLLLLSVYPFAPAVTERAGIACGGLACVDYVINGTGVLHKSTDHVLADSFERRPGGSVPNTAKIIATFDGCRVEALTLIGVDGDGDLLLDTMGRQGVGTRYVARTKTASTQVAFLPVYDSGERACIVVPGATAQLDADTLIGEVGLGCKRIDMLRELLWFNLGYPYELKKLQGEQLVDLLEELGDIDIAVALDMNGASSSEASKNGVASVISEALPWTSLVHANFAEAVAFADSVDGAVSLQYKHLLDECADSMVTIDELKMLAEYFFRYNVAIVAITMGQNGAFLQVNDELETIKYQLKAAAPDETILAAWIQEGFAHSKAIVQPGGAEEKGGGTVGAGDAFVAGMLAGLESLANKQVEDRSEPTLLGLLHLAQTTASNAIYGE